MGQAALSTLCLHCERLPQSQERRLRCLRLCDVCGQRAGLRRVYRILPGWTPEWDLHLQRLAACASQQLPVSIDEPGYQIPHPPDKRRRRGPQGCLRVYRVHTDV